MLLLPLADPFRIKPDACLLIRCGLMRSLLLLHFALLFPRCSGGTVHVVVLQHNVLPSLGELLCSLLRPSEVLLLCVFCAMAFVRHLFSLLSGLSVFCLLSVG
jgi:hypothetical protein